MIGEKKYNIPYKGELWSMTDLAKELDVNLTTLKRRVRVGWPEERWGERVNRPEVQRPKVEKSVSCMTKCEKENLKAYTDFELLQLYRRFRGCPNELQRLADFMASDEKQASRKIVRWKKEGKLNG